MGACIPSRQQLSKQSSSSHQKVSTPQPSKGRASTQPSRLSGVYQEDQQFFKQHIDTANNRKRLNLDSIANLSIIDSDLVKLVKYRWIDQIEELTLENNYLTAEGYRLLVERKWTNLKVLNLAVNTITEISQLSQFPSLQIAYFQRNPLNQSAKNYLRENNLKNGIFLCWTQDS